MDCGSDGKEGGADGRGIVNCLLNIQSTDDLLVPRPPQQQDDSREERFPQHRTKQFWRDWRLSERLKLWQ